MHLMHPLVRRVKLQKIFSFSLLCSNFRAETRLRSACPERHSFQAASRFRSWNQSVCDAGVSAWSSAVGPSSS